MSAVRWPVKYEKLSPQLLTAFDEPVHPACRDETPA
jgi:hypothetical protein